METNHNFASTEPLPKTVPFSLEIWPANGGDHHSDSTAGFTGTTSLVERVRRVSEKCETKPRKINLRSPLFLALNFAHLDEPSTTKVSSFHPNLWKYTKAHVDWRFHERFYRLFRHGISGKSFPNNAVEVKLGKRVSKSFVFLKPLENS